MSSAIGYSLFDTALGVCGLAWTATGAVAGVVLAEPGEAAARERMRRRWPAAVESDPPSRVQSAIEGVRALIGGANPDLAHIDLDFGDAPELHLRIYEVVRRIPPGRTMTYGEVARAVGAPHAAQAVGQAMGRNPCPVIMPCHRVLAADGRTGGFSAPGGVATKLKLLEIEGATGVESLPLFACRT